VPDHSLTLACTCAGCCTIAKLDVWDEENGFELFAEFYRTWQPRGFANRLRMAICMLRGREGYHDCVALMRADVERLHEFLGEVLGA